MAGGHGEPGKGGSTRGRDDLTGGRRLAIESGLVVLPKSRKTHRPVHGAFREAVLDPAFMPAKTGADHCEFSPVHGAY
jgi:hypothetical protein